MKLLLDSHVFLWWLAGDSRLGDAAIGLIAKPENRVWISAASIWEIEIKRRLGKLFVPDSVAGMIEAEGFEELAITAAHAEAAAGLPAHHRDPFDRMLIAQARLEGLVLLTADEKISAYEVEIITP